MKPDFEDTIERMKQIAEVVNAFASEELQKQAFLALVQFAGREGESSLIPDTTTPGTSASPESAKPTAPPRTAVASMPKNRSRTRSSGTAGWTFDKSIDLRPSGKPSFAEFIEQKQPSSNEDRFAAVIYYLSEVLGLESVTVNHIGSVFRLTPTWREPTDLPQRLRVASSRKGTLSASDMGNITLTPHGRNFVEHDLPPRRQRKS